ncbi:MAG: hypothetical protein FWF55_07830 [Treponema sp.]|nr:hypothetical protein [Treponema sp.]
MDIVVSADAAVSATEKCPPNINCLKCVHYKVSWDPAFPHSCTVFGIKSRFMPALEVFRAAGNNCPSFHERAAQSGV